MMCKTWLNLDGNHHYDSFPFTLSQILGKLRKSREIEMTFFIYVNMFLLKCNESYEE